MGKPINHVTESPIIDFETGLELMKTIENLPDGVVFTGFVGGVPTFSTTVGLDELEDLDTPPN